MRPQKDKHDPRFLMLPSHFHEVEGEIKSCRIRVAVVPNNTRELIEAKKVRTTMTAQSSRTLCSILFWPRLKRTGR